jgi:hypothetical protein
MAVDRGFGGAYDRLQQWRAGVPPQSTGGQMGRVKGKRPSPAMVVAIVALVLAVAGTSVAGVATISMLSKKEKKQTRHIATNVVNGLASGLSVASAVNANNATNATNASDANNADKVDGEDATAFARSTQIDSGSGDNTALVQTRLIRFADIGLEVRTDGDADASNALRVVNTRAAGTFLFWSTGNPNAVGTLPPAANIEAPGPGASPLNHDIVVALQSTPPEFAPNPVVSITCRFNVPPTVACIGISSL